MIIDSLKNKIEFNPENIKMVIEGRGQKMEVLGNIIASIEIII